MPPYRLTYYNAKGSVETIRFIFAYAGVEYEDVRIPLGTLTDERRIAMRLGCLPTLEADERVFTKNVAIARYLATKFGLVGGDELELLRIDEIVAMISDYMKKWIPLFYDYIPKETKEEMRKKLLRVDNVRLMNYYDELLRKNQEAGNYWLVGKKISLADLAFAHVTSSFEECLMKTDILRNYPNLRRLRRRVLEHPRIKQYIMNRPPTEF